MALCIDNTFSLAIFCTRKSTSAGRISRLATRDSQLTYYRFRHAQSGRRAFEYPRIPYKHCDESGEPCLLVKSGARKESCWIMPWPRRTRRDGLLDSASTDNSLKICPMPTFTFGVASPNLSSGRPCSRRSTSFFLLLQVKSM